MKISLSIIKFNSNKT